MLQASAFQVIPWLVGFLSAPFTLLLNRRCCGRAKSGIEKT